MKTYDIEIQKVRAMVNGNGVIRAQIDALVQPSATRGDDGAGSSGAPATVLRLSEENARVLFLLLKAQLAEFDARKAKSRR